MQSDQSGATALRQRVLLTGAAGLIGTQICINLGERYQLRGFDLKSTPELVDFVVGDVCQFESVHQAAQGMDAIIHLAGNPDVNQPWTSVYHSGLLGTYTILEAARKLAIPQVIYASSGHVLGDRPDLLGCRISPEDSPHPDSWYGAGKALGEMLGRFFHAHYGLSVICLRIGWFKTNLKSELPLDSLRSHLCTPRDLAQLIDKSLSTPNLGFQIFYGVSANRQRSWDIRNAQAAIGYYPQDNADQLLANQLWRQRWRQLKQGQWPRFPTPAFIPQLQLQSPPHLVTLLQTGSLVLMSQQHANGSTLLKQLAAIYPHSRFHLRSQTSSPPDILKPLQSELANITPDTPLIYIAPGSSIQTWSTFYRQYLPEVYDILEGARHLSLAPVIAIDPEAILNPTVVVIKPCEVLPFTCRIETYGDLSAIAWAILGRLYQDQYGLQVWQGWRHC